MYLDLGESVCVRASEILGIFDLDNITVKKTAREFIEKTEKNGSLITVDRFALPKSLIVTNGFCYISPITPATLKKRLEK